MAGTLTGLEGIRQGRNIKVKPFTIGGIRQVRTDGKLTSDSDFDGGVDIKYGVTSRLALDLTYRTDFSQVEVDEQQVNLTRFSLFFPEKREFFLENSGIFAFGQPVALGRRARGANNLIPFFSRRIGLSSEGTPVPIVGGARLSGSIGSYDLGLLSMKTGGLDTKPGDTFAVGRLKKNVMRNSWVGALFTNRDSTEAGDYNRVYGIDTRFRFFDRLNIAGYLLQSQTPGKEGKDQARQIEAGWTDNDLSFGVLHHEVGGGTSIPKWVLFEGGIPRRHRRAFPGGPERRRAASCGTSALPAASTILPVATARLRLASRVRGSACSSKMALRSTSGRTGHSTGWWNHSRFALIFRYPKATTAMTTSSSPTTPTPVVRSRATSGTPSGNSGMAGEAASADHWI